MGNYLNHPIKEKETHDGESERTERLAAATTDIDGRAH